MKMAVAWPLLAVVAEEVVDKQGPKSLLKTGLPMMEPLRMTTCLALRQ